MESCSFHRFVALWNFDEELTKNGNLAEMPRIWNMWKERRQCPVGVPTWRGRAAPEGRPHFAPFAGSVITRLDSTRWSRENQISEMVYA
jgi:hypothetical protein